MLIQKRFVAALTALLFAVGLGAQDFHINASGYFNKDGVDVMAFNDFYPEGHQGGISVLMNGHRVASNGDIRFEPTPGQWQPVPKQLDRKVEGDRIVTTLCFPDSSRHPGLNQASFAGGVGAESTTVGYGFNRADWTYVPGGTVSGTALIRPDFPELLVFPFLWQQVEYVMGGGSSHYMFLVLAAKDLLTR